MLIGEKYKKGYGFASAGDCGLQCLVKQGENRIMTLIPEAKEVKFAY